MICIYPADCTDFSSNGLGIVQPQSCTVTETLNGEWELTLVHPIDEHGRWTRLSEGNILRHDAADESGNTAVPDANLRRGDL